MCKKVLTGGPKLWTILEPHIQSGCPHREKSPGATGQGHKQAEPTETRLQPSAAGAARSGKRKEPAEGAQHLPDLSQAQRVAADQPPRLWAIRPLPHLLPLNEAPLLGSLLMSLS